MNENIILFGEPFFQKSRRTKSMVKKSGNRQRGNHVIMMKKGNEGGGRGGKETQPIRSAG
jgi:hypothetical protein